MPTFVSQPFFLLLTFGYKLIHQTKMVRYQDMNFSRGNVPPRVDDPVSHRFVDKILGWLLVR